MKQAVFLLMMASQLSCGNKNDTGAVYYTAATVPAAGTVIAADSAHIDEDKLNNFTFSVTVLATPRTHRGYYKVDAAWGYNKATSELRMPKGGEDLKPVMIKTGRPYTYTIGFYMDGDKTFYDYYEVSGLHGEITMQYTKGYHLK